MYFIAMIQKKNLFIFIFIINFFDIYIYQKKLIIKIKFALKKEQELVRMWSFRNDRPIFPSLRSVSNACYLFVN